MDKMSFEEDVISSLGATHMVEPKYKTLDTTGSSSEVFKFENVGDSVEGIYKGNKEVTTKMGQSKIHTLTTKKGDVGIWGNSVLNSNLGSKVPVGSQVRITFSGKMRSPKSGFWFNNFTIEIAE